MTSGVRWNKGSTPIIIEDKKLADEVIEEWGAHSITKGPMWEIRRNELHPVDNKSGLMPLEEYYDYLVDIVDELRKNGETPTGVYSYYGFDYSGTNPLSQQVGGIIVNRSFIKMIAMNDDGEIEEKMTDLSPLPHRIEDDSDY